MCDERGERGICSIDPDDSARQGCPSRVELHAESQSVAGRLAFVTFRAAQAEDLTSLNRRSAQG